MKKYSFYILVVLSITTFFGFIVYYRVQTDTKITLVNKYGDINSLGDVELRLTKQLDSYRGLDIRLNKEGLKKQESDYITDYNHLTDKDYKELARGEKLYYGSSDFLENDEFQAIALLSNENDPLEDEIRYTHKVIIKNKNNGKIVKNTRDSLGNTKGDFLNMNGAAIIQDKLYVLMTNIYYIEEEEENYIQRSRLKLLTFDSNTGEMLEEKVISNEMDAWQTYCISENGNIFFLGSAITDDGYIGGTALYKYNIFQNELEEILYSKDGSSLIPSSDSTRLDYFYDSEIREITEYEDNIYLIDIDNNIICLDQDYNITFNLSLKEALKEYGNIYSGENKEILIYEDKLYFNCISDEMTQEDEITQDDEIIATKVVIAVISLKDNSVLYYSEILSKELNPNSYTWRPLSNRGFHIK